MDEQVKVFDVSHWEHNRFNGYEHVGKTVYNADNRRSPIIKHGQAPCELLDHYPFWFTMRDVEETLTGLGFKKKNEVEWWRND